MHGLGGEKKGGTHVLLNAQPVKLTTLTIEANASLIWLIVIVMIIAVVIVIIVCVCVLGDNKKSGSKRVLQNVHPDTLTLEGNASLIWEIIIITIIVIASIIIMIKIIASIIISMCVRRLGGDKDRPACPAGRFSNSFGA